MPPVYKTCEFHGVVKRFTSPASAQLASANKSPGNEKASVRCAATAGHNRMAEPAANRQAKHNKFATANDFFLA